MWEASAQARQMEELISGTMNSCPFKAGTSYVGGQSFWLASSSIRRALLLSGLYFVCCPAAYILSCCCSCCCRCCRYCCCCCTLGCLLFCAIVRFFLVVLDFFYDCPSCALASSRVAPISAQQCCILCFSVSTHAVLTHTLVK